MIFPNFHVKKLLKSLRNTARKPKLLAMGSLLLSANVKVAAEGVIATVDVAMADEIGIETEVTEAPVPGTGMIAEMIVIVHRLLRIGELDLAVAVGAIVGPHLHRCLEMDPILLEEDHPLRLDPSAVVGALHLQKDRILVAGPAEVMMIVVTDHLTRVQDEM